MLIDWFTVLAQIVNFLILVLLLRKFLYHRIIGAMEAREERIRKKMEDADQSREHAENMAEEYRQLLASLDEDRALKMKEAGEKAEEVRKKLIEEAHDEAEKSRERWRKSVEQERAAFLRELRIKVRAEVFDISRRAIRELANDDLEKKILDIFLGKIENLEQPERDQLLDAARKKGFSVISSRDLNQDERQRLENSLDGRDGISFNYRVEPELILGVELKVPGYKLPWNFEEYLEDLESRLIPAGDQENESGSARAGGDETNSAPVIRRDQSE